MKTEAEIILENPELRRYRVMLYETPGDKFQIACWILRGFPHYLPH